MRHRRTATIGRMLDGRGVEKDLSLIYVDDYSASFEDERFANLSDAERKKRFKSEMSYFQRWLMRARAAES